MSIDDVGEIGQFLSTLLLLQGTADVDEADKNTLIPALKRWKRQFPSGRLASEASERCLTLLQDDKYVKFRLSLFKSADSNPSKSNAPNDAISEEISGKLPNEMRRTKLSKDRTERRQQTVTMRKVCGLSFRSIPISFKLPC